MKLRLLHGSGISASRKKLIDLKSAFDSSDVISFDGNANIQEVLSSLNTQSLLSEEQLIIWENPPEELVLDLSLVTSHLSLVLWFDHKLKDSSKILKWAREQKGEVLNFEEGQEVSVFPFLDHLATRNNKSFLEMKKLKDRGLDTYYFLTMELYLLRNLVTTPKNVPPFVKQKLERQRKNYTFKEIKTLYKKLLEIDFKIKSGLLEKDQADFLMVNMFVNG